MRRTAKDTSPSADRAPKLIYKLDELTPPRPLALPLPEAFLSLLLADASSIFHAAGDGSLGGELTAVDDGALLRAVLTFRISTECSRCLVEVGEDLTVPITMRYVPRAKLEARVKLGGEDPAAERGGSFDPRDLDEEPFDQHRVDLTAALREQLLLALPMGAVLCRDDCKGLCAVCGQNQNERSCGCKPADRDPRWGRLKELKLQN